MQPLEVELGKVPKALPEGARVLVRKGRPVLVIGAAFDNHLRAEQDYILASAMLIMDYAMRRRLLFAYTVSLSVALPLGFISGGAIASGAPAWLAIPVPLVVWAVCYVAAHMARLRRFAYRVDRRMVEVMGQPLIGMMLDFDHRMRDSRPGLVGAALNFLTPHPSQRAQRLDAGPVATVM
ncbi:hypothetical protein FB390_3708 [Nocardia bhagyanarayanae]|uniref:Uncharacterized protein n=1 Tax=Nocardia bhagyanarayanae TaxID=1215925 RepID=A0A543FDT7_9NOCA|nr:hypothetical protein FB390_3708 [Nocardia bhagyanarayanae]